MLALFLSPVCAFASSWYLESATRPERTEVAGWEQREVEQGANAHLVRRFVDGEGWRFVLRTDGFSDEEAAMSAAQAQADRISVPIAVFELDGGKTTRRGELTPAGPVARPPADAERDAAPELAAAVQAVGIDDAFLGALRDGKVLFAYRRTLADGRVVDHTWAATGTSLWADVETVEGAVIPSRLRVVGDAAWMSVDGGPWTSQNTEKVRTTLEGMGPAEVIPLILELGRAVDTRREFERMRVTGKGTFDGAATTLLAFGGDAATEALALELGSDHLPCRVRFGEDAAVHEFRRWSRSRGAWLPGEIRTYRNGALTDTVVIETLDTDANLPAEWFQVP